jgi:glycosyltransferase involved in cell wall biosynthesis
MMLPDLVDTEQISVMQIVASLDNRSAGPTYSVTRLATELLLIGVDSVIACTTTELTRPPVASNVQSYDMDFSSVPLLRRLHFSTRLNSAIRAAASCGSLLHSHGLWTMPNLYPVRAARSFGSVHVISPRGMLAPAALQFSHRVKRISWYVAQRNALETADCIHVTSDQEHDEVRALGIKAPIALLPNGIDLPADDTVSLAKCARDGSKRKLLHLGRLHPKKGLVSLIQAWAHLEQLFPNWQLTIVGPSERGHASELRSLIATLGLTRVDVQGPIFGDDKDALFQSADLFVLPTLNENFGMVVAESLSNGTPVVCSKGAPWSGLESRRAGWWIEQGVTPLVETLSGAMSMSTEQLDEMGTRGREWMKSDFCWSSIAIGMADVYRWCLGKASMPHFVKII